MMTRTTTPLTMGDRAGLDGGPTCPDCGLRDRLVALGSRVDYLHRWRPWATTVTEIYLCERCGALTELRAEHRPQHRNVHDGALPRTAGRVFHLPEGGASDGHGTSGQRPATRLRAG